MSAPSLIFAFVISTLISAIIHLIVGGDAKRLASLLIAGWIGFAIGQVIGVIFQMNLLNIGALRMLPAVVCTLAALVIVILLTGRRARRRTSG
ncbi:MAG: hypothetical protein IAE89_17010 [Anaerolineae bacterium]|nr:hypothetical protein [Anaerolineae bacterium]